MTDLFSESDLQSLVEQTFVSHVDYQTELGSTSDRAVELCRGSLPDLPMLVLTSRQMSGRGRGANQWWAQSGGLTFSLVLPISMFSSPQQLALVSLCTGWGLSTVLQRHVPGKKVSVKWPNDLYLGSRKVCGILSERVENEYLVVGIGINVNNSFQSAPAQFQEIATSLFDENQTELALTPFLIELLEELEQSWKHLAVGRTDFLEEWPRRCLLTGRTVIHRAGEAETVGYCQGLDETGALILQTEHGPQQLYGGTIVDFG